MAIRLLRPSVGSIKVLPQESYEGTTNRYASELMSALRSEENAIINCTVDRDALKIVYTTDLPCPMCAKRFINLGNVVAVYYARPYRIEEGANILRSVGIVCEQLVVQHPLGE